MRRRSLLLGLVVVVGGGVGVGVGCKQAKDPLPASELVTKVRALSAKICACRDRLCADAQLAAWNQLTTAPGGSGSLAGVELTTDHVDTLVVEDERVRACLSKLP